MALIKTKDLQGAALDWAAAKCENVECDENNLPIWFDADGLDAPRATYAPSSDWSQAGQIIEREKIAIDFDHDCWNASKIDEPCYFSGPTPLIAAMRCFVASKLGEQVDVPDELVQPSLKLIKDRYGNIAILGAEIDEPSASWRAIQSYKPGPSHVWFSAYPLTGGACNVQEGEFEVLRLVTQADIDQAASCMGGMNPAMDSINALWTLGTDKSAASARPGPSAENVAAARPARPRG